MQAGAPEEVVLKVEKCSVMEVKKDGWHLFDIRTVAKVEKVVRSKSGLKAGDLISSDYQIPNLTKTLAAGDWPSQIAKGKKYRSYLKVENAKKKAYKPAAASGSFE